MDAGSAAGLDRGGRVLRSSDRGGIVIRRDGLWRGGGRGSGQLGRRRRRQDRGRVSGPRHWRGGEEHQRRHHGGYLVGGGEERDRGNVERRTRGFAVNGKPPYPRVTRLGGA